MWQKIKDIIVKDIKVKYINLNGSIYIDLKLNI